MRDWRTFVPASFKGLRFEVESDSGTGGRNVAVHEYVRAEFHDTEDLGVKATKWTVTAYIASDTVDIEATSVFATCTAPGAGLLVLPWIQPALYRCTEVKRSSAKDTMGKIAFEMSFVAAGGSGASVTPMFDLRAASLASGLQGLVRPVMNAFNR